MTNLPEGDFKSELILSGGTGRVTVQSPADVHIENGVITVELIWSSPNYDLMTVNGKEYKPTSIEGGARFTVEIPSLDTPLNIQAETVAMSAPHMIDYTLTVSGKEILANEEASTGAVSDSENTSIDISSILESLENNSWSGSTVTVFSAVVVGNSGTQTASTGLPPFVTMILGAVAGVVIAFIILAIGKNKMK